MAIFNFFFLYILILDAMFIYLLLETDPFYRLWTRNEASASKWLLIMAAGSSTRQLYEDVKNKVDQSLYSCRQTRNHMLKEHREEATKHNTNYS